MRYPIHLILVLVLSFCSCKHRNINPKENTQHQDIYQILGTVKQRDSTWVYLSLFEKNRIKLHDSALVNKDSFVFSGSVDYPRKAVIFLNKHDGVFIFILANESSHIVLAPVLSKSQIYNSPINDSLNKVLQKSKHIYQKIDYLFPKLQKARVENNYENLKKIKRQIDQILLENNRYLLDYIKRHPHNAIAGILLNEMWADAQKDSLQLIETAKLLDKNIQKNLDFVIP